MKWQTNLSEAEILGMKRKIIVKSGVCKFWEELKGKMIPTTDGYLLRDKDFETIEKILTA